MLGGWLVALAKYYVTLMHSPQAEKCELCHKSIYKHNVILVCSNDSKSYHAKCLKIDNDTAYELQKLPDWCCPLCLKDIIPFFDADSGSNNEIVVKCYSCLKLISPTRHRIAHCNFCDNICHQACIIKPLSACKHCESRININSLDDDESIDFNKIYSDLLFNPFDDESEEKMIIIVSSMIILMTTVKPL